MSPDARKLLDQMLSLSCRERADLAARLIDSLDQESDPGAGEQWDDEISRRVVELDSGKTTPLPWPVLRARLMGRLNDTNAA